MEVLTLTIWKTSTCLTLPSASALSATLENEADATLENEATGSCCLVCRVLGSHAGQGVDSAVA